MSEPIEYGPRVVRRTQRVIRHDTGEDFEQTVEEKKRGTARRPAKRKGFGMLWPTALADVRVSGGDWQVFWKLVAMAEFDTGIVRYSLAEVAVATGPNADVQTSAAIRRLVQAGLVRKVARGRVQLNPLYVWKGDLDGSLESYKNGETE